MSVSSMASPHRKLGCHKRKKTGCSTPIFFLLARRGLADVCCCGFVSQENGLVTASMKLQRNPLREHYNGPGGLLDQMGYRFPAK